MQRGIWQFAGASLPGRVRPGARLYERLGWKGVGVIPGYALMPMGELCDTTVYYRKLGD